MAQHQKDFYPTRGREEEGARRELLYGAAWASLSGEVSKSLWRVCSKCQSLKFGMVFRCAIGRFRNKVPYIDFDDEICIVSYLIFHVPQSISNVLNVDPLYF